MKWIKRFLTVLLLAALAGSGALWWGYVELENPGPLADYRTVVIPYGTRTEAIAELLQREGVVKNALYFKAATFASGSAGRFKAGEYQFAPYMSVHDVITKMTKGDVVIHKLTLPEGLTTAEMLAMVTAAPALSGEVPSDVPQAALLPETYHYMLGEDRALLVKRMRKAMDDAKAQLWPQRADGLPFTTEQEWVTLASIIEKETGLEAERPHVASVYINRLKQHMPLQADPTVAYGIELEDKKPLVRALTTVDLLRNTAYNTYIIQGLPPGPITTPGRASLQAALHPLESNDIYFVATGNGGHRFASTLAEHNRNVAAYRAAVRGEPEPAPEKKPAGKKASAKKKKH